MFKQVIVVRQDLKMGKGKIAAQVAHASLSAAVGTMKIRKSWFDIWNLQGQKKVVLKINGEEALKELKRIAEMNHVYSEIIIDRGLTQIPKGSMTCISIGPAPEEIIDKITGKLSLL